MHPCQLFTSRSAISSIPELTRQEQLLIPLVLGQMLCSVRNLKIRGTALQDIGIEGKQGLNTVSAGALPSERQE